MNMHYRCENVWFKLMASQNGNLESGLLGVQITGRTHWSEVNHLNFKSNYSATSNNTKLVHWRERAGAPPNPLLAVPNVTAHPSTASVPITVLLYDGPLLCGFNVAI